ncbi:hypothetical protein [Sphingomonas sp.]|uniref:hypothetical protein n=1 Tax=Sphingomonas sp. TaxID=28214 RepID=UPI0025FE3B33|nr:hypothetical protein [Sphingomonas sp.]
MNGDSAVGKRVRGALYVHVSALGRLPPSEKVLVERASRLAEEFEWSVARIESGDIVGLLDYPLFDTEAFPALARAALIDIGARSVRYTDYQRSLNPLILHRKELLVADSYPGRERWAELTADLERLGLFRDHNRIGRRNAWLAMLASARRDPQGQPF